jgi:hypothetical protein
MTTQKNISPVAKAFADINAGKDKVAKGKLALTAALIPLVLEGNLYSAIAGEGESAVSFSFKLAEYSRPTFHHGEPVKGAQGAKFAAFCEAHGAEPNKAMQSDFVKCLDAAIAIALGTSGAELKGGKFVLPLGMCKGIDLGEADKPSATAKKLGQSINFGRKNKLAGAELFAAIAKEPVECIGGDFFAGGKVPTSDQAIAALQVYGQQTGLIPPKGKRENNKAVTVDKVRDAMATVNKAFVMIEKSDESPIAFTAKDEMALREMAQHIAAYFAV